MASEAVKMVALVKLEPQDLLRLAVENKADISTLERLVALAKDVRAEQAKEAWHDAMTTFQQVCPAIKKGTKAKIVTRGGASYEYSYAPLDDIMSIARPVLAKLGLTATWRHPTASPGSISAVCRIAHTLGHHEDSEAVTLPISQRSAEDRGGANDAQRVGMALTYSKRYAFLAISGLTPEAEDDDSGGGHEDEVPATRPAAADGSVLIVDVQEQTGNKKSGKGTWTKWAVTFDDGIVAGTFTKALAEDCRKLMAAGSRVIPKLEQDGNFTNLIDLRLPANGEPATEPAQPEADRGEIVAAIRRLADTYAFTEVERMGVTKLILKGQTMGKAEPSDLVNLRAFLEDKQAVADWRAEFKALASGEQIQAPF